MIKLYPEVARQFVFLKPEDKKIMAGFINNNPKNWNMMDLITQQDFIEEFVKSRNKPEFREVRNIQKILPTVMRQIEQSIQKIIYNTESPIENAMVEILINLKVDFETQKTIGRHRVDFLVKPNVIIECDGAEWHRANLMQILGDNKRDKVLMSKGYIILRYSSHTILNRASEVKKEINAVIKGDSNE